MASFSAALMFDEPAPSFVVMADDPKKPKLAGVTSLYILQDLPTTPLAVRIKGGRAYVGNVPYRGVIAIDIQKSLAAFCLVLFNTNEFAYIQ